MHYCEAHHVTRLFFVDLQSEKHRRMLYSMEMEQMAENAKTQMEDVSHIHTDFVTATQIGHVKTMFKVIVAGCCFLAQLMHLKVGWSP